ncbi:hypothetical protein SUGI_0975130 [Cryptomeria japonica]|nr:hypothetical protein SUGI_0975130 [Cryptomeria japonica]
MASSCGVLGLISIYVVFCAFGLGNCASELHREEVSLQGRSGGVEKEQSLDENMVTQTGSLSMPLQGADGMAIHKEIEYKREKVEKENKVEEVKVKENENCEAWLNELMVTEVSPFWVPVEEAIVTETYRKFKRNDDEDDDEDEDNEKEKEKKKKKKQKKKKKDEEDIDEDKDNEKEKEKKKKKKEEKKKRKDKEDDEDSDEDEDNQKEKEKKRKDRKEKEKEAKGEILDEEEGKEDEDEDNNKEEEVKKKKVWDKTKGKGKGEKENEKEKEKEKGFQNLLSNQENDLEIVINETTFKETKPLRILLKEVDINTNFRHKGENEKWHKDENKNEGEVKRGKKNNEKKGKDKKKEKEKKL